jgi:hypothetical protein
LANPRGARSSFLNLPCLTATKKNLRRDDALAVSLHSFAALEVTKTFQRSSCVDVKRKAKKPIVCGL